MNVRAWLLCLRYIIGRRLVAPVIRLPRAMTPPKPRAARRMGGAK